MQKINKRLIDPTIIALLLQEATQKYQNSQIIGQNIISLCPSLCLLWLVLPSPSSIAEFF